MSLVTVTVRVCHTTGRIACLHPKMPRWKSQSQNRTLGGQHFLEQEGNLSSALHVWLMQSTGKPPGRSQCDYLLLGMNCGRVNQVLCVSLCVFAPWPVSVSTHYPQRWIRPSNHVSKAPEQTLARICPEAAGQVVLCFSALAGTGGDLEWWSRGVEDVKIQALSMSSPEHVWPRCLNLC